MLLCDVCQQPATEQCPLCRIALCGDHGGPVCFRCAAASRATDEKQPTRRSVFTVDKFSRRVWAESYLQCESRTRTDTIYVEDDGPPSCHECGALARTVCRNCQQLYCPDHAGVADLCRRCHRSSLLGLLVLAGVALFWVALLFLGPALVFFRS